MSCQRKRIVPRKFFYLVLAVCFSATPSWAGEIGPSETEASIDKHWEPDAHSPHHEMEGSFFMGYRFLSLDDFAMAGEYQYPHSSLTAGLDLASYPLPHRFHLNTEILSKHNAYGDIGYAYSDLLLLRDIFAEIYHNLEHYDYQHAGEPPAITYDDRNTADQYHVSVSDNFFSLRLKAPDFPFHTFLQHRYIKKEGSIQQRSMIGYFDAITKTSQTRAIDWKSNALTLGTNSHLGQIELEYSYELTKFDPGKNDILYDFYPFSPDAGRPADTYPHDVNPETESAANALKVHTSYTGGIVASATLSNLNQKNNYSGTESDIWQGALDLSFIPLPSLNFFFRYRHKDLDIDTPDFVTLTGLVNTNTYAVRQAVASKKDVFSLSAKYRPWSKLTLLSTYEFEHHERKDADDWRVLPEYTDTNSIKVTAYIRPSNTLKLNVIYGYRFVNNPALNIEPDYSNQIKVSTTYTPISSITAFADYNLTLTDRDNVRYLNGEPDVIVVGDNRDTRRDRFLGSLTFLFSPKTTVTASWAYYRGEVEQDLAYGKWNASGTGGDLPYLDPAVPYTDEANSYSLSFLYTPKDDLAFLASLSHTISKGDFITGMAVADTPVSLASFSSLELSETIFSFEVTKKLLENWEVGVRFLSDIYDDKLDDQQDGTLYISTVIFKRHF